MIEHPVADGDLREKILQLYDDENRFQAGFYTLMYEGGDVWEGKHLNFKRGCKDYSITDVHKVFGDDRQPTQKAKVYYARVSSEHQRDDLERQNIIFVYPDHLKYRLKTKALYIKRF